MQEEIEDIKRNIDYWESEVVKYMNKNDISSAIQCRILANHLRKQIGEDEK